MANRGIIISLCDLTGHMVEPWVKDGYIAVLVDPQHPEGFTREGSVIKIGATILEAMQWLRPYIHSGAVKFVAGFPPCTDVALCGTRHWAKKRAADPYFQAKAAIVAEQCRMIGELSGAAWFFENPKSAFSKIFGKATSKFHPHYFTGFCASDNYTKDTWLWTGGGLFNASTKQG